MKNGITNNIIWRLLEKWGAQGVSLIVSIVLARIIDPAAYGAVAIITVFTSLCTVFIDGGFSASLIQKKNADQLDYCTVFYFNLTVCFALYSLLFISSPFIANYYHMPILKPAIRVQSITLILSGFKGMQTTYISKKMQFKKFFFATLGGTIFAAFLGIGLAIKGFGIWALVVQSVLNNCIDTIVLWIVGKWRPCLMFSFRRLKGLFSYGWKLLLSSIVYQSYADLRQLIIGKMYSSSDLAFYNKAHQFPTLVFENTLNATGAVLFPVMSLYQDDNNKIKELTKKVNTISSYLISPVMLGLAAVAKPFIIIVLGENWISCVPYLQIFCIMYGVSAGIGTSNQNALKAIGKSNLLLYIEIAKCSVDICILLLTMKFGVFAIAIGMAIGALARTYICAFPAKKYYDYSYLNQIIDVLPNIISSIIMGIAVYILSYIPCSVFLVVPLQIITGVVLYLVLSILTKNRSYEYVKQKLIYAIKYGRNQ